MQIKLRFFDGPLDAKFRDVTVLDLDAGFNWQPSEIAPYHHDSGQHRHEYHAWPSSTTQKPLCMVLVRVTRLRDLC